MCYYYHRFRDFNLDTLYNVIESGFILPRKILPENFDNGKNIFNGNSWISLSQKAAMDDGMMRRFKSSYNDFIFEKLCAVIDTNIEGITYPEFVDFDFLDLESVRRIKENDGLPRFSEYLDEVQTNVPIPIQSFLAVGYPLAHFQRISSPEEINGHLDEIEERLNQKGVNIPILNSSMYDFADSKENFSKSKIKRL